MASDVVVSRGTDIRVRRYAQGLKVRELAERVGISPTYLSAIERGRFSGSPAVLKRIAVALDVEVADIVGPAATIAA